VAQMAHCLPICDSGMTHCRQSEERKGLAGWMEGGTEHSCQSSVPRGSGRAFPTVGHVVSHRAPELG
jgi:hypothetical protein